VLRVGQITEVLVSMRRCFDSVHGKRSVTRNRAKANVFEYVEVDYSRNRLHSTLDYLSPDEFKLFRAA
jgi:transposase InsO family protein